MGRVVCVIEDNGTNRVVSSPQHEVILPLDEYRSLKSVRSTNVTPVIESAYCEALFLTEQNGRSGITSWAHDARVERW